MKPFQFSSNATRPEGFSSKLPSEKVAHADRENMYVVVSKVSEHAKLDDSGMYVISPSFVILTFSKLLSTQVTVSVLLISRNRLFYVFLFKINLFYPHGDSDENVSKRRP